MAPLRSTLTLLVWLAAVGAAVALSTAGGSGPPSWGGDAEKGPPPGPPPGPPGLAGQQGAAAGDGASCATPRGQHGRCIRLHSCRPLLDLLRTSRLNARGLPDVEVTLLLRKSHCGFQGSSVMVCCPDEEHRDAGDVGDAGYRPMPDAAVQPAATEQQGQSGGYAEPTRGPSFAFAASRTDRPSWPTRPARPGGSVGSGDIIYSTNKEVADGGAPAELPEYMSESLDGHVHTTSLVREPDFPAENLALLPTEVCGLRFHPAPQQQTGNHSALMQYPWMARLGYRSGDSDRIEYLCTGSLISERYVLTAAHCIGVHNGPVTVRLGDVDLTADPDCVDSVCAPNAVDVAVEQKLAHEDYRKGVNDIALLRLARPVTFSEAVSPVCLPVPVQDQPEDDVTGRTLTVAGWGNTSPNRRENAPSRWLLHFRYKVALPGACRSAYGAVNDVLFDTDKHLCVGPVPGTGGASCHGDSGSPLMLTEDASAPAQDEGQARVVLAGLLSYGLPDCALRAAPLVFTRASHFVPWVLRMLRPNPFVPKDRSNASSGAGLVNPRDVSRGYGYAG